MNSEGITFQSRQSQNKNKKDARQRRNTPMPVTSFTSSTALLAHSLPASLETAAPFAHVPVAYPVPAAAPVQQEQLFPPNVMNDFPLQVSTSSSYPPIVGISESFDDSHGWMGIDMQGMRPAAGAVSSAPITTVQSWMDDAGAPSALPNKPSLDLVPQLPVLTTTPNGYPHSDGLLDCDNPGMLFSPLDITQQHTVRPSDAIRESLSAQYEQHFLPPGTDIPESVCIRVLDSTGSIAFCAANKYTRAAWNETYLKRLIEFPGNRTLDLRKLEQIAEEHHSLFPPGLFSDDDYKSLLEEARVLLTHESIPLLLGHAMYHVNNIYPIVQQDTIHQWLSLEISEGVEYTESPPRHRVHRALLLLLCGIGVCIGEEIKLVINGELVPVRAWEFGDKCYRVARGLLTPKQFFVEGDELSVEYVQGMLLMHLYLLICESDPHGTPLSLHVCMVAGFRLYAEPGVEMTHDSWELLKRTLWTAFTFSVAGQLEHLNDRAWYFPTRLPDGLEAPSAITGENGDDLSPEVLSTFLSDIRLHAYMAQLLDQQLYGGTAPISDIHTMRALAITLRNSLLAWERDAEALKHRTMGSSSEAQCRLMASKTRAIYDVGMRLLTQFLHYTTKIAIH